MEAAHPIRYRRNNQRLCEGRPVLLTKTIPLSLSILWRFAVTFPILLIGLFLYGTLGGVIGFVIALILPGTLFIATLLISASSGVIPIMVGARFGFQSKLIRPGVGYRKLIVPANKRAAFHDQHTTRHRHHRTVHQAVERTDEVRLLLRPLKDRA